MSQQGALRVFFALWPPAALQDELGRTAATFAARCGGRAVNARNVHLTLFFVGRAEPPQLVRLSEAAARVRCEPFELALDRIGYWRHNRILWAGPGVAPPALLALAADLRRELGTCGVRGEVRRYSPHVTLVRNAERKPDEAPLVLEPWPVDSFALVQSVSVRGGVRYEPLVHWPFSSGRLLP